MPSIESASILTPSSRPEVIQQLIDGVDRYNPDNVSILEEYLAAQCQTEEYDLMANLAILKLYQFNPHLTNETVIYNILAKALTAIPEPDFNLSLYLLDDKIAGSDEVSRLTTLQQLLEQSRYSKFWETYSSSPEFQELTAEVKGFGNAIRRVISKVVAMTYQKIEEAVLRSYLNLEGDAFASFLIANGWKTDGAGSVLIGVNKLNEATSVVIRESLRFEQLTKVIGYSNEL